MISYFDIIVKCFYKNFCSRLIADAIKSVGEAFTSLFNYFITAKSVQSETEVIKDKHKAEAANNIAEDIFLLVDKCRNGFTDEDWNEYLKLKKKFNNKD